LPPVGASRAVPARRAMAEAPPLRALILAAGRGERMRPLTDRTPKPLLPVHGKPLIVWHLEALARAGVREVVVNTAWLEEQFPAALGDGSRFGLAIRYSHEGRDHGGALETAGGIAKALPWLGEAFWVVSGDVYAPGFRFEPAAAARFLARPERLAQLWLVPNPPYHPDGDFGLGADGLGLADGPGPDGRRYTYANLALVRAGLCAHLPAGTRAALGPLLYEGMRAGRIGVERYDGEWHNVGTPAQLRALDGGPAELGRAQA
jgi:MurNAc alpha-1-phosphate uridylyltransferase